MNTIILDSESKIKEQVVKNTNDISTLKSNVKWIYQYGGVGGNGKGTSGGDDDWSLYVTLGNELLIQDTSEQKEVILDSDISKDLIIQINKPGGKIFTIEYIKYYNGTEIKNLCDILSSKNKILEPGKYKFEFNNLNIQSNGVFLIKVNCDEENTSHLINYFCITNPLSINLNYVTKNGNQYTPINTIDVNTLKSSEGLYIKLNYTFYTRSGNLYYQILQSSLPIDNVNINDKTKLENLRDTIYFKLDIDYEEYSNLGYQMFSMNLIIDEEGIETPLFNSISCTIIPNEMYLQVVPVNTKQIIYSHQQEINNNLYTFVSGIHAFNLTAYSGSNTITNNKFNISCIKREQNDLNNIILPNENDFYSSNNEFIQDVNILTENLSVNVSEHVVNTHQINLVLENQDDNVHLITLSFMMKYNNIFSQIRTIYIYVIKNKSTINWYRDEINNINDPTKININYYRNGLCKGNFINSKFTSTQYLQFRKTDNEQSLINLLNNLNTDNFIIHIGLQFSDINKDNDPIIKFEEINGNNIVLYQNKIYIGSSSSNIYIPKEENYNPAKQDQYHLISILKNLLYDNVYAITIYIDGVIENSIDIIYSSTDVFSFYNIHTYKSNFSINLLEVSYIDDIKMSDNDISRYWDAYFDQFILNNTNDQSLIASINADKIISNYIDSISFTKDNFIEIKNTDDSSAFTVINNIALSINTPVLLIDYDNINGDHYDDFVDWFTRTYSEGETVESKDVSVYYSPGKKAFGEKISTFTNTTFYIEPQGSSTLGVRAKNLNLGIRNISTLNTIPVFTPNFSLNDTNTFLPESKFTLKADHVDSSHSNNTSIGKFINENTVKFSYASQGDNNSVYVNHIKNCLLGFPILVFVKVRINAPDSPDKPDLPEYFKYYYLGIYNFNLGRNSYFNMGYYPLLYNHNEIFDESLKFNDGNFSLYQINKDAIEYKDGLIITEIQGGDPHFDFSEYDETILFQCNNKNKKYMFGDHVPEIYDYDNIQADGRLLESDKGTRNKKLLLKLVKNIAITGGLLFKELKKNFGSHYDNYNASVNTTDRIYDSINQVPDFRQQYIYDFNNDTDINNPQRAYSLSVENSEEMSDRYNNGDILTYLNTLIKYETDDPYDENIYIPLLDYRSLVEYYVACMVFGLVDSVQKNLNLKSWNVDEYGEKGTFYTAFYDMDTCLGRDNGGDEVKYFAFSDYWNSSIDNNKLSEITIYRDFYPVRNEGTNVPIGYDIPSSYLFAIAKYARMSIHNGTEYPFANDKYPSPNMIYALWRHASYKGNLGEGSLRNAKYFIDTYFDTLKNIPTSLINHNYRFKYLMINKENNSYSYDTIRNKKPFHGRGKYSVIDWLSNRLRLLDAYFDLAKTNPKVQKYDIETDNWSVVKYGNDNSGNDLSLNEYTSGGSFIYNPDSNNEDIYILSDIFGKSAKLNKEVNLEIKSNKWAPIVITTPMSSQQFLVPEEDTYFVINVKPTNNIALTLGGSQYWTYVRNLGAFVENNGININSKYLTNIGLDYNISANPSSWIFNTPSVTSITLNNPNYNGTLKNYDNNNNDLLLNLNDLSLASSGISLDFKNNGFRQLDISGTTSSNGINISSCNNFNKLIYNGNTNISSLNISRVWDRNITLSSFTCQSINIIESNELYNDASIIIDNINELKEIVLTANFKKIQISNCKSLEKIVLPKSVETLIFKNNNITKLFNNFYSNEETNNITFETISHMTDDDKTVIDKRILHLENLIKLKAISFENTLGFDRIILPNNDIELLAKAFYETDIKYINFADNLNDNHKLILCSENNECSIFYNSSFTLSSDDINLSDLKFSVKNKLTSLEKLFRLNRRYDTLGVHNGTPLITYGKIQRFIKNLENKQYVINFDYACDRQSLIIADYQLQEKIYIANGNINITQNSSRISFDGYTHLKSLQGAFEHTYIKFFDDVLFSGTFASDLEENETINILNVLPYDSLNKMHINALQNIKTKIESFMFDGDDNGQSRSVYSLALSIYNTGGELNQINVHDLLFVHHNNDDSEYNLNLYKDECIKLTMLSGFKINSNQKIDINDLFTAYEQSITNIHDSFTNLDQSENGSLVNITNFNLQKLKNLSILYNSFVGKIGVNRQLDNNKTIDILHYLDWTLQYSMLQSYIQYYNVFNFYKHVNLITEQDETDWDNFWKSIMATVSENNIVSVNYLLSQCIFNMNKRDSLEIPYYSNNIVYANGLFANSQCYVNNENTGFILSDTTLRGLYNVAYTDNMFDGCTLNGTQNYPLPVNLLSPLSNLKSCIEMFNNTKIKGTNKTYIGENSKLVYYYQKFDNIRWNYTCTDSYIISKKIYDTFEGYPFIPPTFFSRNTKLENIKGIFSNSDFEGYIPDNLLLDYLNRPLSQLKNISNFVYNCKILPQKYYKFTNTDTVNILLDNVTPKQNITAFTFIPENFIREGYDLLNNIDIFNFKLLGSGNPECRLYLFTNNSISKFIPNINLCIDNESRIVNNWYKIDDITNPYEHAKPVYDTYLGYINICINKKDDNVYSEGLTMNMWNMVAISQSALIDPYLASIYYGYIFEPGTLLYNINSAISSNKYFVHTITDLTKPNSQDRTDLIMSPNLLLPGIIYYTTVNPDAFPNYYKNVPKEQIKNKYAYECLFKVNKENSVIDISHFDMSFIDIMINSDNIEINYNENTETYICTIHYNTFEYTKYYKNIESSLVKNQFINDCRNDLKQLVYNNYYLLFDKYSDIIFSMGNDNTGTGNLAPYYSFRIDNDTDSSSFIYITSIDDPNQYVRRMYNVTGYMGDYGIIASVENPA